MDILEQSLGIAVAILCILSPQLKKKWHMLLISAMANLISGINYVIFVGFAPSFFTNMLATAQVTVNLYKTLRGKPSFLWEKIVYWILSIALCLATYKSPTDLLIMLASTFFALSIFCKKEQNMRLFMLGNIITYIIYNILVGSTNLYSQIVSLVSVILAIIRYRKVEKLK